MTFSDEVAFEEVSVGNYQNLIREGWETFSGRPSGGYLMALIADAMIRHSGDKFPYSINTNFLTPGVVGNVRAECEIIRSGSQVATIVGKLGGEKPMLQASGVFGDFRYVDTDHLDCSPPEMPEPELCSKVLGDAPFLQKFDRRAHPDDAGGPNRKTPPGSLRGWFRLLGEESITPLGIIFATDAFPPTFRPFTQGAGWAPTIELNVHQVARASTEWLKILFNSRFVTKGLIQEDAKIWDANDRLIAHSRQICLRRDAE